MKLDLDWEVALFKVIWQGWERWRAPSRPLTGERVTLLVEERSLTLLARALTERHLIIQSAPGWGYTDGGTLFLPPAIDLLPTAADNRLLYRLITVHKAVQIAQDTLAVIAGLPADPVLRRLFALIEGAWGGIALQAGLPGLARWQHHVHPLLLAGRPLPQGAKARALEVLTRRLLGETGPLWTGEPGAATGEAIHAAAQRDLATLGPADLAGVCATWAKDIAALPGRWHPPAPVPVWGEVHPEHVCQQAAIQAAMAGTLNETPEDDAEEGDSLDSDRQIRSKVVAVPEDEADSAILFNRFEQVETAEDYFGLNRPFDDDGEIGDYAKALDDLNLDQVIRTSRRAKSLYHAELMLEDGGAPDIVDSARPSQVIPYDEWFASRQSYRPDWCWLQEKPVKPGPLAWADSVLDKHAWTLAQLKRRFRSLRPEEARLRRQPQGDETDLDAVVEARGDMAAGLEPSDSVYLARRPRHRDLAVAFLIDCSASTDAWVLDRRVLDLEKESLLLLGEALDTLGEPFAMYGFSSRSRKACHVHPVKTFTDPYGSLVKQRLAGLEARDFTRIGPAIRHVSQLLAKQPAAKKILFLVSDGKPNDFDVYEGRHGIADVRKALDEGRTQGIRPFCVTIDSQGRSYLPAMFGATGYLVVDDVRQLPKRLPEAFLSLLGR